ncbi:MAG: hypothetical protein CL933_01275 [Deltaproteobacteria bacterium]|nr:hypothetical protein [Deltaproteobacteria bacterium]
MGRACPYCESQDLGATEESGVLRCCDCGRSSLMDERGTSVAESSPALVTGVPHGRRSRMLRRAPGEVASWPAALTAIVATLLFYALLSLFPDTRVSDLFTARGWVPYVITGVSFWALLLLGARLLRLREEAAALDRDLIATGPDGLLGPADASRAVAELLARAQGIESSFIVARLERALRHFEARQRVVEVVEFLTGESSADEGRVDASYALIRVFVWAVPTLGFIGTVIGIGSAVGGFSETLAAASSLEGMKESIGQVTGGLGVAFDTTLLALVMSILIMFPASAVQRIEETFLGEAEDYCSEYLVRRLRDDIERGSEEVAIEAIARKLVVAMGHIDSGGD